MGDLCNKCGVPFEVVGQFTSGILKRCPKCLATPLDDEEREQRLNRARASYHEPGPFGLDDVKILLDEIEDRRDLTNDEIIERMRLLLKGRDDPK